MIPEDNRILKNIEDTTNTIEALLVALLGEIMLLGVLWTLS